jgi:hypothetical protein
VEAVGDLPPYVAGMVAALLTIVLVPGVIQNRLLQLVAFYSIPLSVAALFYQPLLLARATGHGYARTLLHRLPAVLISTNLAVAGLLAVGLPLIQWQVNTCGLNSWTVLVWWWIIAALGTVVGGLLVYAYHAWEVRRGFIAWSTLWDVGGGSDGGTAVSSPPWRRLWAWIVISFVTLVGGVLVGVWGPTLAAAAR